MQEMEKQGHDVPAVQNKPGINFTVARLSYKAANFYHKYKNEAKMVEALERLPRVEDRLEFLKKRLYVEQAATMMVQDGKTTEAAKMMLQHGKVEKALEFAERGDDQEVLGDAHYAQALALKASKDGFNQEKIISHLTTARDAYTAISKTNSVGVTSLDLASIKLDMDTAKLAFQSFRSVQPYPNVVGMLEALDLVVQLSSMDEEFADIMAVVRGVDALFGVMQTFLKPASKEDGTKSQLYLQFYGLHVKDSNTLVVYPKLMPRCAEIICEFYATKQEKKQPSVEKDRKKICIQLSFHFAELLRNWIKASRDALRSHVAHRLQCKSQLEGEECPDKEYCPYLHENYNRGLGFRALEALLWEVHLDSILQTGAHTVKSLVIPGMEAEVKDLYRQISFLVDEDTKFDSCERLLDFMLPEHHHMRNLTENRAVARDLQNMISFGKVALQVTKYLEYSWRFHDKKLSMMDLLERRSKSVDWFARATLFSSIFKLKMDINKTCQQLERDLMRLTPGWLDKRRKYALLADFHKHILTVESLGRKSFEVHNWLQESPVKAVIEYAKYVKILGDRVRISVFPKMPLFLFWQEVFICVAFFCIAKLSQQASRARFVLPATYLATIPFVNTTFSKTDLGLQELVERSRDRKENITVVRDRLLQIAGVMCGPRMNLLRIIFTPKKDNAEVNYLQAERALIFALVLLVNIGVFVPVELEQPLMSTIMKLHLSDKAPSRLRETLHAVKQSRGIADVVAILRDMLYEREEEYLLICYWRWDGQRKQGNQFQQLKKADHFSSTFHRFDPSNLQQTGDASVLDEGPEEEGLGLTPEEAQRRQKEVQLYDENLRRDKAAKVIQRYIRWRIFNWRLDSRNLKMMCMVEERNELFAPFEITEKMCGICGIPFQTEELAMTDVENLTEVDETSGRQSPDAMRSLGEEAQGVWSQSKPVRRLESHKTSAGHVQGMSQFETYKHLHMEYFEMKIPEMRKFITKTKLKDSEFVSQHYPDQELDVSRLTSQMDDVLDQQKAILDHRKWQLTGVISDKVLTLYHDYLRVGPEIKAKYREYLEQQQRSNEARNESHKQKTYSEEMHEAEDWDKEMIDVVEEPVPRKEARIRTRPGRGREQPRDRGDNLGGDRAGRGRGRARERHHRDFVGDTAPRFQKDKRRQQYNEYQERRHQVQL